MITEKLPIESLNRKVEEYSCLKNRLEKEYKTIHFKHFSKNIHNLLFNRYKKILKLKDNLIVEKIGFYDKLVICLFGEDMKISLDSIHNLKFYDSEYRSIDNNYENWLLYIKFISKLSSDLYYDIDFKNEFSKHVKFILDKKKELSKITKKYYNYINERKEYISKLKLDILLKCLEDNCSKMMGHKGHFVYSGKEISDFRYMGCGKRKGMLEFEVKYRWRDKGDTRTICVKKYNFLEKLYGRIKRFPDTFIRVYKLELFMNKELNI